MNTGQLLVSLSGLPSGSALAHLMAVQVGTGTGPAIVSYRAQIISERRETRVVHKSQQGSIVVSRRDTGAVTSRDDNEAFIKHSQPSAAIKSVANEAFVVTTTKTGVVTVIKSSDKPYKQQI